MTTLHIIVNVIIIHYICCRVVRSPISFCKLLCIYQYLSIITIVLTSLDPHMGPITLRLSMHYNRRYCLLYVFTLSRTTLVLYKDKFCLVLFHFHIFSLTNISKLSRLYILYLKYNIINYLVLLISYYVHLASLIYVCITCIHVNHVLSSTVCINKSYLDVKDSPLNCRIICYVNCNTLIKKFLVHCSKVVKSILYNHQIYTKIHIQFCIAFDFKLFTITGELIITYWNYNELGTCIAHVNLFVVLFIFLLGKLCKLFCSLCYSIMLNRVFMCTPPVTCTRINRGEGYSFE